MGGEMDAQITNFIEQIFSLYQAKYTIPTPIIKKLLLIKLYK